MFVVVCCDLLCLAIGLFDEIVNSRWFRDRPCFLVFNKRDLFEVKHTCHGRTHTRTHTQDKIKKVSFKRHFPKFAGNEKDFKACADYLQRKFLSKIRTPDKQVGTVGCRDDHGVGDCTMELHG